MITYSKQPLTFDYLRVNVPSAIAFRPHESVSDRYQFISTLDVFSELQRNGFQCYAASQTNVKLADRYTVAAHQLRFRSATPVKGWSVGDILPEIILHNSHDRSGTFRVLAGFQRLWCANGCAAPIGQNAEIRTRHSGNVGEVIEAVYKVIEEFPAIGQRIQTWQTIELNQSQQLAFATSAAQLRWDDDKVPVDPATLLKPVRAEDTRKDLFTTYQVIQEHLVKGGDRGRSATSTRRRMRTQPVKSILEDTKLNKSLWTLTEKMAELVTA